MAVPAQAPTVKNNPFRIVIIKAGVADLTLTHSLENINVDYVLLDKGYPSQTHFGYLRNLTDEAQKR